ncbi:MAG: type II toxin-antitoxin system VapC family toxin [Gammaproteobacteria bacterium]|nr:type II toxin-antitoxin system VapC family toxin [Gammaproteobacteria bacterium]MBU1968628.1 type II toxin-antitoxin system VapC family toxin [Gammaproteobacteria bacterium]
MLDTNAASSLIRGRSGPALQRLMTEYGTCISVITEAELLFGVRRRPDATRLAKAVEAFLQDVPSLPWTSVTAEVYAEQRTRMESQGIGLSAMDLLIATHALAENCTLISADRAFTQVPGLRVLDWTGSTDTVSAQRVRDKLAGAGISVRDVADAVALARSAQPVAAKSKAVKNPRKK